MSAHRRYLLATMVSISWISSRSTSAPPAASCSSLVRGGREQEKDMVVARQLYCITLHKSNVLLLPCTHAHGPAGQTTPWYFFFNPSPGAACAIP